MCRTRPSARTSAARCCATSPTSATCLPCWPRPRGSRCRARTSAAIRRARSRHIERTGCRASRSRPWMASTSPSGADLVGAYIDYGALAEATVAAAGNSAEVPVAGAAVTTVIKSGSNTPHGEVYADYKPGGHKPLRRRRALCAVSRHQRPARWPVHQGPALVLHVIPRSVHRAHDRDVRQAASRGRHPGSAVHHPNDRIHHQAESSTQRRTHPDVHDAVGHEVSTLSFRFRRLRPSISRRVDGDSGQPEPYRQGRLHAGDRQSRDAGHVVQCLWQPLPADRSHRQDADHR